MNHRKLLGILSCLFIVVLTGAGALSCKSAPQTKTTVKLALSTPFNTWQSTYAIRQGIITSDKVDLQIQLTTDAETQMLAGNVQFAAMSTSSFAADLQTSTVPLTAISTMVIQAGADESDGVNLLIVKAGSAIKSPADLVGKKVGVPGLTSSTASVFLSFLKQQYGIDESQLSLVDKSNSILIELLRSGSLDAAVLGQNVGVQASLDPTFSVLWNLDGAFAQKYGTPCVASLLVVNSDFLAKNPDAVKETLYLLQQSVKYGQDHLSDMAQQYAAQFGQTAEFYELIYKDHSMVSLNSIEGKTLTSVTAVFQAVKDRGIITTMPDPAVVFKKV